MRLWDRITGGAAGIEIECDKSMYQPGEILRLRATISAKDGLEAKSALATLQGIEEIRYQVPTYAAESDTGNASRRQIGTEEKRDTNGTVDVEQRVVGPLHITGAEPYVLEAELQIPRDAPVTYAGPQARHYYRLMVELDVAWSNNPSQAVDVVIGFVQQASNREV